MYQAMAIAATVQVDTSGVRKRGWMCASLCGIAARRAIDSPVRDAGMIVVWVEASAEVDTDSSSTQSQPPRTCSPSSAKIDSSSPALSARNVVPAKATTA